MKTFKELLLEGMGKDEDLALAHQTIQDALGKHLEHLHGLPPILGPELVKTISAEIFNDLYNQGLLKHSKN